jgi:beta-galactosidase
MIAYAGARRPATARAAAQADEPLPAGVYDLNENWLFGGVYAGGSQAPGYSEAGFAAVTLPHTVTPLSWGDWDGSTWEKLWIYRRHISSASTSGPRVFVDFQGVMTSATVYLGGTELVQHQGGYLPWSVELTPHLVAGDNVLAVVVDGTWQNVPPDKSSATDSAIDYLQPAGIYRDVTLRAVPEVFISDVFAKPTGVLTANPGVEVQFTIDAATVPAGQVQLAAQLLDGSLTLGSGTGMTTVTSAGVTTATISIAGLSNIGLWSPESPKLYQVNAILIAAGISHNVQVTIGFRDATFKNDGFYLNGEKYPIFGLNRHQLFPYTGMAAPERLQRRDAELLKSELNCNMVRCSHYPQSPYFLDACDELGLMVWEEPPGWQYVGQDATYQNLVLQNVQDMIVRDRNRPSVIVWATRLNETSSPNNQALYVKTRLLAASYDGTRQTTGAMSTQSTTDWAQDIFAYDDYHSTSSTGDATLEPPLANLPYLVSEAVGALDGAPLYRWIDTEAVLATQARMHAQVHDLAQSPSETYAGLLGWSGFDYASLNGGDRIWHNLKWAGVMDTFRVPKPGAAIYRSQVDPSVAPVILPVFFWDFGAGSPADGPGSGSMIATNCDQLEIYVGGVHFASATPDRQDYANLRYPPAIVDLMVSDGTSLPDLRVDGLVAGTLVGSLLMSSDPSQDRLVMNVEDASIQGDGTDMTRFTFRALDAYGNQRPYPTGDVQLALSGPATLLAENPFSFAAYGGVGGAFIRSQAGGAGTVTVTVSHPTLGQTSGNVSVIAVPGSAPSAPTPPTAIVASPPPTPPPTSPTTPTPAVPAMVSRARVRSALTGVLSPKGAPARLARLLKNSGYTFTFTAPSTGKLVIDWYFVPKGSRLNAADAGGARSPKRTPVLVASAATSIKRAGRQTVKVKLTRRGRSLLKPARRERLTAVARFTAIGSSTVRTTRVITLRR